MKILHYTAPSFLFVLHFLHSNATRQCAAIRRPCRNGTRAFPSAVRYYFSRRIFPQMNFMKTVFALLINRSSVAVQSAVCHSSSRADLVRSSSGRLLIIILFQRPLVRGKVLYESRPSLPPLIPFPAHDTWFAWFTQTRRDVLLPFFLRRRKGGWKNC